MKMNEPAFCKDWPEASGFKCSIRRDITLFVSIIILIMMLASGYIISNQYVKTVTRAVAEKMLVQARSYSSPAGKLMLSTDGPDALLLNNSCKKLVEDNPDICWAGITDAENIFLAHTDLKKVISAEHMISLESNHLSDMLRPGDILDLNKDTLYISVPIMENNVLLGRLDAAASVHSISAARRTSIITVASITILMILLGIPVTMFVLQRKLRPISIITDHLKNLDFNNISLKIPLNSKDDFGYLAETLEVMGVRLNAAQKDMIEKERFSRELEIAREIQASLLPKAYPTCPEFEFAGIYQSAKQVGGDYYDFIEFDDDHLGILVADVSGKSLPGMLVMLMTRNIVKAVSRRLDGPGKILAEINRELKDNIKPGMFVTMFLGIFDKPKGKFSFASAGHNPLIWYDSTRGECNLIKTRGYPLAMMKDRNFADRIESGEITLSPNDWIIQYTDGINEAKNPDQEEYGLDRLLENVKKYSHCEAKALADSTLAGLNEFVKNAEQYDDITLLTVKWLGRKRQDIKQPVGHVGQVYADKN